MSRSSGPGGILRSRAGFVFILLEFKIIIALNNLKLTVLVVFIPKLKSHNLEIRSLARYHCPSWVGYETQVNQGGSVAWRSTDILFWSSVMGCIFRVV